MHGQDDEAPQEKRRPSDAGAGAKPQTSRQPVAAPPPGTPVLDSAQIFGGHRQVVIGHNGCRYVLRITKHGKLILNK
jgi:hemin uptake protein HemP